jgi:hypothetical protein
MAVKKRTAVSATTVARPSTRSLAGVKAPKTIRTTGAVAKGKANATDGTETDPAVGTRRKTTGKSTSAVGSPSTKALAGKMAEKRSAKRPKRRSLCKMAGEETAVETPAVTSKAQAAAGPKRRKPAAPRKPRHVVGLQPERTESRMGDQSDNDDDELEFEMDVGPRFNNRPRHNDNDAYDAPATVDRRSQTKNRRRSSSVGWSEERVPAAQFRPVRTGQSIDCLPTARHAAESGSNRQWSRRHSPLPADNYETIDASLAAADAVNQQQHQQQSTYHSRRPAVARPRCEDDEYDFYNRAVSRSAAFQQPSRRSSLERGSIEAKHDNSPGREASVTGPRRPLVSNRRAPTASGRCQGNDSIGSDDGPGSCDGTRRHQPTGRSRFVSPTTEEADTNRRRSPSSRRKTKGATADDDRTSVERRRRRCNTDYEDEPAATCATYIQSRVE